MHLKQLYLTRVFISKVDSWPWEQDQIRNFISVPITQQSSQQSKVEMNISEMLSLIDRPHPCTTLIEGSLGIGKTNFLKEISYQWANGRVLKNCDVLFLLYLRDPFVHEMSSLFDFVHYFFEYDASYKAITTVYANELSQNGGQSVTLLLDCYHEYARSLQQSSLIAGILQRKVLPACSIVLTSRKDDLTKLHLNITYHIKMVGLSKEIEKSFISEKKNETEQLYNYFEKYPAIAKLCCIPLYINMLLFLCKEGSYLCNFADVYNKFVCLMVNRYHRKLENKEVATNIKHLQQPFSNIIEQLSKLAFKGLQNKQKVFDTSEVKKECPNLQLESKFFGGLGIIRAVKRVGSVETSNSFCFLHYSIQQFLAAYYLSKLPPAEILELLQKHFFHDNFHCSFIFYVGITKGCDPPFREFISDGNKEVTIADKHLSSQIKCICLYQCFNEIDDKETCKMIKSK